MTINNDVSISLILATVSRVQEVDNLIESLCSQSSKEFELIVVDQNLDDRLCMLLRQAQTAGLHVRHVRTATVGLAHARNLGLTHSRHEVILFQTTTAGTSQTRLLKSAKVSASTRPLMASSLAGWSNPLPEEATL